MSITGKSTLFLCLALGMSLFLFAWPTVYPTGTTLYKPDKSYNGYTLYSPMGNGGQGLEVGTEPYEMPGVIFLVDMNGNIVHEWKTPFRAAFGRILRNGNLLVACSDGKKIPGRIGIEPYSIGGAQGWIYELDWDGNIVWSFFDGNQHHDFRRLPNGNLLYIAFEKVPKDLQKKVRGGVKGSEFPDGTMVNDLIVEVTPEGERVWEWHANDHFDPDIDIMALTHPRQEWAHGNGLDVMEDGNILYDARHTDTAYLIDKKTGKIIWRFGNIAYLDRQTGQIEYKDPRAADTFGGQHNVQVIRSGLPGAGNILIYDNGMYADTSRAVEINPKTLKVVWEEKTGSSTMGRFGRNHFSSFISSVQRLPNGNTLVCDGANGRLFEITREQEIVWEYINPFQGDELWYYVVYRATRYGPDHCPQFKDLPPAKGAAVGPINVDHFQIPPMAQQ
jgi:outer membrane protein assembly factor BamB